MDCERTSAADCARDCGDGVQWPNERKPIFFIQFSVASRPGYTTIRDIRPSLDSPSALHCVTAAGYICARPPSTNSPIPTVQLLWPDAGNKTAFAISSAAPGRRRGILPAYGFSESEEKESRREPAQRRLPRSAPPRS